MRLLNDVGVAVGRGNARAKILTAAIDTFAKNGVAATRVEDILVAANLSRRTFYQHFTDKIAVVHAIYELVTRQLAETLIAASAGATDPMTAILRSLDAYLEIHRTDRAIVKALIEESLHASSPLFAIRAQFRRQIAAALDMALESVTRRQIDPLVSLALVSALEGISLELLDEDISDDTIARSRAVIASLIRLVFAHPDGLPPRR
ncbi:MAG: TetR/AcrR family transcriptional regulator [Kofleriaceae bacterium]|nr:TetR/AcrR family transcriptional regulator [Kofleriaceae bacterium]